MSIFRSRIPVLLLIFFLAKSAIGQVYQFKQYGVEQGLSHPFVYSVAEDKNGFVWVATGEGLCKFDGFQFKKSQINDSLTNGFVTKTLLDKNGILWFGHNSGQITYYDGTNFNALTVDKDFNSSITDISSDQNGNVFIASQNSGLIKINQSNEIKLYSEIFAGQLIYSAKAIGNDLLLIGTDQGLKLYKITNDNIQEIWAVNELEYITVQSIDYGIKKGTFWLGTEDAGFYLLTIKNNTDSYQIKNIGEQYEMGAENIQSIVEDKDKTLRIATFGKGVFKLTPADNEYEYSNTVQFSMLNGLPNNFIKQIYRDWEGNYWIATYGKGLVLSVDEAFTMRYQDIAELKQNIISIEESDKYFWLGGDAVLIQVDKKTNNYKVFKSAQGLPNEKITALFFDDKNNLWIGSEKRGIFKLMSGSKAIRPFHRSANSLGNKINSITGKNNLVYVATQNGVIVFDQQKQKETLYNTEQGLPHNDIKYVYIDSDNKPWIATSSNGIFELNTDHKYTIEGNANLKFTSITQDTNGHLWAATYGLGVFKFENDSLKYYSTDNGLKSNYCYSIIADDYGKVWIGHRLGMSSIDIKTKEVKTYGSDIGITGDCNTNAVLKTKAGQILTGTTSGLVYYDGSKQKKNKLAPKLNISELKFSDMPVNFKKSINLPYKVYKMKISFVGLSFYDPEGVLYQYKLDGYDLEWSKFSKSREVYYPRIEDGDYTFMLKSCNSEGICIENPLEIKIYIKPPIWKRWWFILLVIISLIALVYWYINYRERKQRALQEYLENELEARTKEVIYQKEELEIKNRDITDSINYAQRIQKSILPSINTITNNFSGAFVYYKPRDIVSGDFYWYDKVNDDKFLIVCADSTGHGVPGAFMSMIGTTLIKDICMREYVNSPSDVLRSLDEELQSTLNQNVDAERANDGMDIIVCEIDVNTHYMRFASAMRPLILYKNNELQYVRGTKASIGGDSKEDKKFENIGFQLNQGDTIYMFSDGYPDQFGGPRGKKFKMDRVKNMLSDVCEKAMNEQHEYVNLTFNQWKGKLQQVDDVLFMGVRI